MRKWIVVGAILIAFIVVASVALLNINSLIARNKSYLLSQAEAALGRKVSVGEAEATLFSGIGVRLTNFAMSDDPAFASGDFVRSKDLQVNLKFWPLLRKEVQVKRVILHDPVIRIVRNADGKFNFSTIGKQRKEPKGAEDKERKERAPKEEAQAALLVSLVDISGGDLRYVDRKEGTDLQVRQVDLKVEDFDFDRPFSIKLDAALFADRQNLGIVARVGPLRSGADAVEPLALDGKINLDPLDMNRLKAAAPKWQDMLPKDLDLAGVFRLKNLKFKGTLKDLTLDGELEATEGALRYGKSFQKSAGIPMTLSADARYQGERIAIRKSLLKLHSLELASAGRLQLGDSTMVDLAIDSKPATLEGWDKIVPALASYKLAGTMELQATVRGKLGKGGVPELQGTLSLSKASAQPPDFPKPIENLDTSIKFSGQRADIRDMALSLGRSRIRLSGAVEKFAPLTLTYKMSTPELWPADYQSKLTEERKADVIRDLQSEGQFSMADGNMVYQGKLRSAAGTLHNVAYKGLDAALSLADKVANIRSLRVDALSGALQMAGEYAFKETTPRFAVSAKVQGIDVKALYAALDAKAERDISGKLNADLKLAGSGKNWEEVKPSLSGQGEATVLQGRLHNFNIAEGALGGITGIPGLANMISPSLRQKYPETFTAKDTDFKELTALVDVVGGRINIKNLRMAAAEFIVQGSGWADFNRRVDMRATMNFSERLSTDLARSAREVKYLANNRGEIEIPFSLTGKMPNVKPKPDTRHLGQMVQRGFLRKGVDELQNRFLGGRESSEEKERATDDRRRRRDSTEDLIRKGLEGFFKR